MSLAVNLVYLAREQSCQLRRLQKKKNTFGKRDGVRQNWKETVPNRCRNKLNYDVCARATSRGFFGFLVQTIIKLVMGNQTHAGFYLGYLRDRNPPPKKKKMPSFPPPPRKKKLSSLLYVSNSIGKVIQTRQGQCT